MGGLMEMLSASVFKKFVAENGRSRTAHTLTRLAGSRGCRARSGGAVRACVWQQG